MDLDVDLATNLDVACTPIDGRQRRVCWREGHLVQGGGVVGLLGPHSTLCGLLPPIPELGCSKCALPLLQQSHSRCPKVQRTLYSENVHNVSQTGTLVVLCSDLQEAFCHVPATTAGHGCRCCQCRCWPCRSGREGPLEGDSLGQFAAGPTGGSNAAGSPAAGLYAAPARSEAKDRTPYTWVFNSRRGSLGEKSSIFTHPRGPIWVPKTFRSLRQLW